MPKHYELHLTKYEIAGAHCLKLPYESPCQRLHGHNWAVSVHIKSTKLSKHGMILDFKHIKDFLKTFDHQNINELVGVNPTAENLAEIFGQYVYKQAQTEGCTGVYFVQVDVQEAEHNVASWVWEK